MYGQCPIEQLITTGERPIPIGAGGDEVAANTRQTLIKVSCLDDAVPFCTNPEEVVLATRSRFETEVQTKASETANCEMYPEKDLIKMALSDLEEKRFTSQEAKKAYLLLSILSADGEYLLLRIAELCIKARGDNSQRISLDELNLPLRINSILLTNPVALSQITQLYLGSRIDNKGIVSPEDVIKFSHSLIFPLCRKFQELAVRLQN